MRVVVVGAGAIGLSCALALAERGARVTVLDAEPEGAWPSRCASRAAAGMLGPFSETLLEPPGVHPRLFDLCVAALDLWRAHGPALGLATFPAQGARLTGYEGARLTALAARVAARGARALWRGEDLVLPDEGVVDAPEALAALTRALADRGGAVRRGAAVAGLERGAARLASGERVAGDEIVLCPGVWGGRLNPALAALTPMKGQIAELVSSALAPGETIRAPDFYAVGRAGGRVLVGSTMEPGRTDLEIDPDTIETLARRARTRLPALAAAPVARAWAGVRPMSADGAPRIGRLAGALVACGHSRNGWLLAPLTGRILAAHAFADPLDDLWTSFAP
jgi:glycine oxidase